MHNGPLAAPWTVLDLFAGVGGLSFGFDQRVDFTVVAANEILSPMAEAYRLNHPKTRMYEGDIKDLSIDVLKRDLSREAMPIDVVVGGPPCQAYSTVGKRLLDDPRGQLFQEYFRLVAELRPTMFLYENVKGLLSMQGGDLFGEITRLFASLGYRIQTAVLNAADYGAPQIRERVIVVGTTGEPTFSFPRASHRDPSLPVSLLSDRLEPWLTLGDAISDLPRIQGGETSESYACEPRNQFQALMRIAAPERLMDHNAPNHGAGLLRVMRALPEGGGQRDLPPELRPKSGFPNTYARLWWDRPSTTITRNLGTPSSSRCIHPYADRGLTTREGARLQSFPDRYHFAGSRSDRNLQIGNAVPPLLSAALAESASVYLRGGPQYSRDSAKGVRNSRG